MSRPYLVRALALTTPACTRAADRTLRLCAERGEAGDIPSELSTDAGRRQWLARELEPLRVNREPDASAPAEDESDREDAHEFDAQRIVARTQGREGWLREAKRQLDRDRWLEARPIPRSRAERLGEARRARAG